MPHKSFTSPTGGEPLSFDLNGVTFHCIPRLPAGLSLDAALATEGTEAARRLGEFFDTVLVADEATQFAEMIRTVEPPEAIVPMATLQDIIRWLVAEYTGRPTGPQSGSGAGPRNGEAPSTVAASSPG